jgi:type IV pilus assembly protein PilE
METPNAFAQVKPAKRAAAGFSLIELMATVLIVGILMAIAVPSYSNHIRKSRRTEAKTALLDLAGREERYYNAQNNAYTAVAANLGYAAAGATTVMTNFSVGSGYYLVTVTASAAGTFPATYSITATPTGTQAADTTCTSFTVDQTGQQTAAGPGGATCWN